MSASEQVSIRVPREHFRQLGNLAVKHDRSVSYFVRIAIERFLREIEREDLEATRA